MAAVAARLAKLTRRRGTSRPEGVSWNVYKAFTRIDRDGSGILESHEMVACFEQLGRGVTQKQADRLCKECGPLVNQKKDLTDGDGNCNAVDVFGFAMLQSIIDEFKPPEPFLRHSIISDLGIVRVDPVTGYGRPLPYQKEVREAYMHPVVVWSVAVVIIGNFVVNILEKEYDPNPRMLKYEPLWDGFDTAFNAIFLVELLWNLYGFGFGKRFWYSGWNVFDFVITAVGVVLLSGVSGPISQLKLLRAFRVFRLFKRIKSLNKIVVSLLGAVPGVANAFVILFIFFCIYSILAVELFRDFGINGTYQVDDLGIGEWQPERHILDSHTPRGYTHGIEYWGLYSRSMLTLFQIMTGDSWAEGVARPMTFGLYQKSTFTVSFFMVSFFILTNMVLANVVVAVLLDQFVAPPPAGLKDSEVTDLIVFIKETVKEVRHGEGGEKRPEPEAEAEPSSLDTGSCPESPTQTRPEFSKDERVAKLVERMEHSLLRTERTDQSLHRLESKLEQLFGRKGVIVGVGILPSSRLNSTRPLDPLEA